VTFQGAGVTFVLLISLHVLYKMVYKESAKCSISSSSFPYICILCLSIGSKISHKSIPHKVRCIVASGQSLLLANKTLQSSVKTILREEIVIFFFPTVNSLYNARPMVSNSPSPRKTRPRSPDRSASPPDPAPALKSHSPRCCTLTTGDDLRFC
jgi:hypothetical protein